MLRRELATLTLETLLDDRNLAAQASPACSDKGACAALQLIMVAEPEKNQLPVPLDSSK